MLVCFYPSSVFQGTQCLQNGYIIDLALPKNLSWASFVLTLIQATCSFFFFNNGTVISYILFDMGWASMFVWPFLLLDR